MMLATTTRVSRNTADAVNETIRRQTEESITYFREIEPIAAEPAKNGVRAALQAVHR